MSGLQKQFWIGFDGEPLTGNPPPRMTVYGPPLTREQEGAVNHAYRLFCIANQVALGEYQVRNRTLPDGTKIRMTSTNGRDHVEVWTPNKKPEELKMFGGFLVLPHTQTLPLGWGKYPGMGPDELGYYNQYPPFLALITPHRKYKYERFVPLKAHQYDWWGNRPVHVSYDHGLNQRYWIRNHDYGYTGSGQYPLVRREHAPGKEDVYVLGCRVVTGTLKVLGAGLCMGTNAGGARKEYINIVTRKDLRTVEFWSAFSPAKELVETGFFATYSPTWVKIGEYTHPNEDIELEDPWYFDATGKKATTVTRTSTGGRTNSALEAFIDSSNPLTPTTRSHYIIGSTNAVRPALWSKEVFVIDAEFAGDGSASNASASSISVTVTTDAGTGTVLVCDDAYSSGSYSCNYTASGNELVAVDYSPNGKHEVRVSMSGSLSLTMIDSGTNSVFGSIVETISLGSNSFSFTTVEAGFIDGAGDIKFSEVRAVGMDARAGVLLCRTTKSESGTARGAIGAFPAYSMTLNGPGNDFAYAFMSKRTSQYKLLGVAGSVETAEVVTEDDAESAWLYSPAALMHFNLVYPIGSFASETNERYGNSFFINQSSDSAGAMATLNGKWVMAQLGASTVRHYLGSKTEEVDIAVKLPPHGSMTDIRFMPIKVV